MKQINMEKFSDEVSKDYAKDRIIEKSVYKNYEWKLINRYIKKNYKILDLCCGPGTFLIPLSKKGYDVEGLDFSLGMINEAKKFAKKEKVKIKIKKGNATNIKRKNDSYDMVLLLGDSIGSIPENESREKVIRESYRILKRNGVLIITFGNRFSSFKWWLNQLIFYLRKISNRKFEFGDIIYDFYGRKGIHHNYSKKEIKKSLKKEGFKIIEIIKIEHKILIIARK